MNIYNICKLLTFKRVKNKVKVFKTIYVEGPKLFESSRNECAFSDDWGYVYKIKLERD